ncbi:ran-interacting mog1 protein, partial [Cystoisospora suis]
MLPTTKSDRTHWIPISLFGGAMTVQLPDTFKDVSALRQVPDNQEVFMDMSRDQSLVIEIVEHQTNIADGDAARFFFCDLAKENGALETDTPTASVVRSDAKIPVSKQHTVILARGFQPLPREAGACKLPVQMAIIRIPEHNADILVSFYGEPRGVDAPDKDKFFDGEAERNDPVASFLK